jgi:hypothetical protein
MMGEVIGKALQFSLTEVLNISELHIVQIMMLKSYLHVLVAFSSLQIWRCTRAFFLVVTPFNQMD